MYAIVLTIHSYLRWLVLFSLLFALYRSYRGWLGNQTFTPFDNRVRHITATLAHIQLLVGVWLYSISPLIHYFLTSYGSAVKEREIRFFGMEHSTMMLTAIIFITIGSAKAKRKPLAKQKFKTMALWFFSGLLIILFSIPWKFSPMASRPYFRIF